MVLVNLNKKFNGITIVLISTEKNLPIIVEFA